MKKGKYGTESDTKREMRARIKTMKQCPDSGDSLATPITQYLKAEKDTNIKQAILDRARVRAGLLRGDQGSDSDDGSVSGGE